MRKVDINVDIGEGFAYDEALLEFATSANVCCGEHAGDYELTRETAHRCLTRGVRVGAHPGFPDRATMGRRIPHIEELEPYCASLVHQVQLFRRVCDFAYIKPHGAWYNFLTCTVDDLLKLSGDLVKYEEALGRTLARLCAGYKRPPMLLAKSLYARGLNRRLYKTIAEGFADRRYLPNSALVPRSEAGATLEDPEEIRAQVLRLAGVVDSICVHGDTPKCVEIAELVRKTLVDGGYEVGY